MNEGIFVPFQMENSPRRASLISYPAVQMKFANLIPIPVMIHNTNKNKAHKILAFISVEVLKMKWTSANILTNASISFDQRH